MQSASGGMLSVIGLLACASAAGVVAAHRWPQGPPPDLPQRAWNWLEREVLSPRKSGTAKAAAQDPAPPYVPDNGTPFDEPPPRGETPLPEWPIRDSQLPGDLGKSPGLPKLNPRIPSEPEPPRHDPGGTPLPLWPGAPSENSAGAGSVPSVQNPRKPLAQYNQGTQLEALISRAEKLGAVVVRLERNRGPGGGYLFRCELPLPRNPRYHRFFQASDAEPARAVERVLRDVEAWQATLR